MAAAPEEPPLVSEADGAFYSFCCVMLALYLVPGGLYALFCIVRGPRKALFRSRGFALHLALLALALAAAWHCMQQLQSVDTSGMFDPYEILGVTDGTPMRDIKRAFRRLGRELHPDKNLAAPRAAAARFARVTKAYEALTDPIAMKNYRLYGHPDGRQALSMQFAFLSAFTGESGGNGSLFVLLYFVIVFGGVAWIVYKLHKSSGRRDPTHVSKRTRAAMVDALRDKLSVHDVVELLLSSDEMVTTTGGDEDRERAAQRAKAHDKVLKKMEAAKVLPADTISRIKKHPDPIARENMIALYVFLRRAKMQGVAKPVWVDQRFPKVLLELPFLVEIFAQVVAEHSVKRAYPAVPLLRTLSLLPALAQGSLVADDAALREQATRIKATASSEDTAGDAAKPPGLDIAAASLTVLDEPNIQAGDWLTLQLTVQRRHVAAGRIAPLAATMYDQVDPTSPFRLDNVWVVVMEKGGGRLYAAWKVVDLSAEVAQTKGFFGPDRPGKYEMEVRVLSSPYLGVEAAVTLPITVEAK